jgi:hypothetical protein
MTKRELPEGRKPLTASESADLVKKMHDKLAAGFTAGDRIAQLEELYKAALEDAKEAEAYAEELEAKLAKAVEILEREIRRVKQIQLDLPRPHKVGLFDVQTEYELILKEMKEETDE